MLSSRVLPGSAPLSFVGVERMGLPAGSRLLEREQGRAAPDAPVRAEALHAPLRILFLVRSLGRGGAERQVAVLARGLRRAGHHVAVAVFYGGGAFEKDVRADGIPVHDLAKTGRWDFLPFCLRLARLARAERPHVLHSYMGANAFSPLKVLFPSVKIVWGVRTAKHDLGAYDWLTRLGPRLQRLASPFAHAIVANSEAARLQCIRDGLDGRRILVIPNGIDCDTFRPDDEERSLLRRQWGIADHAPLVGVVARLDPVKGHANFLRAAALVASVRPDVRFVCVGGGKPARRAALARLAAGLGLGKRLAWAGEREVTRGVYGALDVAVLSSNSGESFPNVVAEAMACGRPCVATDTGDAALIVGDAGAMVPTNDPAALSSAVLRVLALTAEERRALGARNRTRIEREYSVDRLVQVTERALTGIVRGA